MNPNLILSVAIGVLALIMLVRFFIDKRKQNQPQIKVDKKDAQYRKGMIFDLSDYDKLVEAKKKQQPQVVKIEPKDNQTPGAASDQD